ncbi:MAG: iron-sulfur cluster-binding domain-containing protein [Clostridiales bacterium]|nr:iron-sulfur cluster-binding domain-containing protein [Candidatus Cacconaster stercorequi]
MAKYNYDKKSLKGLGVGAFLGEVKTRNAHIEAAEATIPTSVFNANRLAKALHPSVQFARVSRVIDHGGAKSFVLVPDTDKGTQAMAYFRAGQYVSLALNMDGVTACRPYSIRSNPVDALGEENTSYTLTVKHSQSGQASEYILNNWAEGTEVILSGPLGNFYYQSLRDAGHVVALAGGSGITPFCSMACAIADGIEDFDLTILYGSRTHDDILLRDELDAVAERSNGRVKVVYVLSDEKADGYEHGFLTAELIKKYAGDGDYSIYACGPKAMYAFLEGEVTELNLPRRRVRFELSGEYGDPARDSAYPTDAAGKTYRVTVMVRGEERVIFCRADQTLLRAMEEAGISVPSDCRSGQCGWCHSRLISGEVFVPESVDGRREADKKFGWIHPCCTYPISDVALEVRTLY